VWTGSRMIMFAKGGAVTFDPATDEVSDDCCGGTWFQSTPLPLNGGTLLIGGSAPSNGGAVYVPPSAAESAALARR